MDNLESISEQVRKELTDKDEAREKVLPLCRDAIRHCSTAIRAVHRQEFEEAKNYYSRPADLSPRRNW